MPGTSGSRRGCGRTEANSATDTDVLALRSAATQDSLAAGLVGTIQDTPIGKGHQVDEGADDVVAVWASPVERHTQARDPATPRRGRLAFWALKKTRPTKAATAMRELL